MVPHVISQLKEGNKNHMVPHVISQLIIRKQKSHGSPCDSTINHKETKITWGTM
jgi:hypothetical protein